MTSAALPEGRYGPPPTQARRRRTVAALVATAVVGVGLIVWLAIENAQPAVSWKDVGFVLDGNRGVEVVFDVMRADPSVPVQCRLQALNDHYAQVGVVTVDIGPGERGAQRERAQVATSELATTGVVHSCWVADQG